MEKFSYTLKPDNKGRYSIEASLTFPLAKTSKPNSKDELVSFLIIKINEIKKDLLFSPDLDILKLNPEQLSAFLVDLVEGENNQTKRQKRVGERSFKRKLAPVSSDIKEKYSIFITNRSLKLLVTYDVGVGFENRLDDPFNSVEQKIGNLVVFNKVPKSSATILINKIKTDEEQANARMKMAEQLKRYIDGAVVPSFFIGE